MFVIVRERCARNVLAVVRHVDRGPGIHKDPECSFAWVGKLDGPISDALLNTLDFGYEAVNHLSPRTTLAARLLRHALGEKLYVCRQVREVIQYLCNLGVEVDTIWGFEVKEAKAIVAVENIFFF